MAQDSAEPLALRMASRHIMPLTGRFKSYAAYSERKLRTRPPVDEEGEQVGRADGAVNVEVG